jgi:hypothetical protein
MTRTILVTIAVLAGIIAGAIVGLFGPFMLAKWLSGTDPSGAGAYVVFCVLTIPGGGAITGYLTYRLLRSK